MNALSQSQLHDKLGGAWHGNYFSCRCPFHDDDKPSLLVYADGGYCMGCRKSYSLQKLSGYAYHLPETRKETYGPRLDWKQVGTTRESRIDFRYKCREALACNQHLKEELYERGIKPGDISMDGIGYWEGWYVFPIHERENADLLGFVLRASKAIQNKTGHRYTTPPGQPDMLFWPGSNGFIRAYVVFGMFDVYSVYSAMGRTVVTGTRGQGLKAKLLKDSGIREFTIIPDKGEEAAAYKLQKELGLSAKVLVLDYPEDCKDPNDVHVKHGAIALRDLIQNKERVGLSPTTAATNETGIRPVMRFETDNRGLVYAHIDNIYGTLQDIQGSIGTALGVPPGQIRPINFTHGR